MNQKRNKGVTRLLALTVSLVLAIVVSACTIQTPNEPEAGTTKNTGASVTITWGVQKPKKEADEAVYNKVISEYMKLNPKVQVKMAYTEYADDAQWTTWLNSQLLGGAAPD